MPLASLETNPTQKSYDNQSDVWDQFIRSSCADWGFCHRELECPQTLANLRHILPVPWRFKGCYQCGLDR